jgi:MFS-type transporter involved in bile tolerance (Atg22 family)
MTISALGDGIYTVALAWQVYDISNTPSALSIVGVAWFLPQIAAVLLAGVIAGSGTRSSIRPTPRSSRRCSRGICSCRRPRSANSSGRCRCACLGLVLAAGGIGALIASISMAERGLPRKPLAVVYLAWAIAAFCLVGYAESDAVWEAALVSALSVGSLITGQILWESLLQRCVPEEYLGRVASVDSFVSSGLVPLSLALTGPSRVRSGRW